MLLCWLVHTQATGTECFLTQAGVLFSYLGYMPMLRCCTEWLLAVRVESNHAEQPCVSSIITIIVTIIAQCLQGLEYKADELELKKVQRAKKFGQQYEPAEGAMMDMGKCVLDKQLQCCIPSLESILLGLFETRVVQY